MAAALPVIPSHRLVLRLLRRGCVARDAHVRVSPPAPPLSSGRAASASSEGCALVHTRESSRQVPIAISGLSLHRRCARGKRGRFVLGVSWDALGGSSLLSLFSCGCGCDYNSCADIQGGSAALFWGGAGGGEGGLRASTGTAAPG